MTKVVIDTNVFVSSFFGGNPGKVISLWRKQKIILCLSRPILDEYIKVLEGLGLKNEKELEELIKLLAEGFNILFTTKTPKLEIVHDDPDDNKFIECAVALESKIIISGDNHLKSIQEYMGIKILSPKEFLNLSRSIATF